MGTRMIPKLFFVFLGSKCMKHISIIAFFLYMQIIFICFTDYCQALGPGPSPISNSKRTKADAIISVLLPTNNFSKLLNQRNLIFWLQITKKCEISNSNRTKADAIIQMQGGGLKVQRSVFKNKSLTLQKVLLDQ